MKGGDCVKKENRKKDTDLYCLPSGTRLNQRYILKNVLGQGGFGITYLGWDEVLEMPVAVKEYYPEGMVGRKRQGRNPFTVVTYKNGKKSAYEKGKEAFLKEARVLSQLCQLEGIVLVRDFFQENETAYIVMEYIDGISAKEYVQQEGGFSVEMTLELMKPVLQSLYAVHEKGLIHRDLSPDNIIVTKQGKLKLIDFGAARYASAKAQKTITVMYKQGFSALEQYGTKGAQGVWTDVYGISATMYYMLTGSVPEEAADRIIKDDLQPLEEILEGTISKQISDTIQKGMEVLRENRFPDIGEFYWELYDERIPVESWVVKSEKTVNEIITESKESESGTRMTREKIFSTRTIGEELQRVMGLKSGKSVKWKRIVTILLFCVIFAVGIVFAYEHFANPNQNQESKQEASQAPSFEKTKKEESISASQNQQMEQPAPKLLMLEVTGNTKKQAKQKLTQAGFSNIHWKYKNSQKVQKGIVIRQNISAGEEVEEDQKVVLVVSKGKKKPISSQESDREGTSNSQNSNRSEENSNSIQENANKTQEDDSQQGIAGSLDYVLD